MVTRSRKREAASALLDTLFDDPDLIYDESSEDDPLEEIDRVSLREEMVERLGGRLGSDELGIVMELFGIIGLGKSKGNIARVVTDTEKPDRSRCAAAMVLLNQEPELAQRVISKLTPDEQRMIEEAPVRRLLGLLIEDPVMIGAVSGLLEGDPDIEPQKVFERVETIRRGMGLFPMQVYEDVFFFESLEDLVEPVVELVIEERDPGALEIFRFIERNLEGNDQAQWREVTDRVEREIAGRPPERLEGQAWISHPNPPFPSTIALVVENPEGTKTFGMVDLGESPTTGRGGAVIYDPDPALIDEIPGLPQSLLISPGLARAIFERHHDELDDEEAEDISLAWVELMTHLPLEELPQVPERTSNVSEDDVRALLDEPPYDKWLLNPAILGEHLDQPEPFDDPPPEWTEEAVGLLDEYGEAERLADAFHLMSLIHLIDGNQDRASLAEAVARGLEDAGLAFAGLGGILLPRTFREVARAVQKMVGEEEDDPWAVEPHEEKELLKIFIPVVKKQLKDRRVPFVRQTFDRLRSEGMSANDAMRAIALQVAAEAKRMTIMEEEYDDDAYIARLDSLTGPEA